MQVFSRGLMEQIFLFRNCGLNFSQNLSWKLKFSKNLREFSLIYATSFENLKWGLWS